MKTQLQSEKTGKTKPEKSIRKHLTKKSSIEDLLVKNLIRTNMQLLKSLDLRSIVLF